MSDVQYMLRVRRLALRAMLAAGGWPRLEQIERAGLVVRASSLAVPPRRQRRPKVDAGDLVTAYCQMLGEPIPARFARERSAKR